MTTRNYENEGFSLVDTIPAGDITISFPGTDMIMSFENSNVYVNSRGDIGHLPLGIRTYSAVETGEPEGIPGMLGRQLLGMLSMPGAQDELTKRLANFDHHFFYSVGIDSTKIVTVPGSGRNTQITTELQPDLVAAAYTTVQETLPSTQGTLDLHMEAVGDIDLRADRENVVYETLRILELYDTILTKAMEQMVELAHKNG